MTPWRAAEKSVGLLPVPAKTIAVFELSFRSHRQNSTYCPSPSSPAMLYQRVSQSVACQIVEASFRSSTETLAGPNAWRQRRPSQVMCGDTLSGEVTVERRDGPRRLRWRPYFFLNNTRFRSIVLISIILTLCLFVDVLLSTTITFVCRREAEGMETNRICLAWELMVTTTVGCHHLLSSSYVRWASLYWSLDQSPSQHSLWLDGDGDTENTITQRQRTQCSLTDKAARFFHRY